MRRWVSFPPPPGRFPPIAPCRPSGKSLPLILVVQEIFGVHEHIKDVCRRLAKLGYCAVAPELYRPPGRRLEAGRASTRSCQGRRQGARRPGHERPRRDRRLGARPARATRRSSASPASAGAAASCGSTRHTTRRSRPASPGTGGSSATRRTNTPSQPDRSGRQDQGAGAGPVRRAGRRHPGRHRGADAGRRWSRRQAVGVPSSIPDAPHAFFADYRPSLPRGGRPRTAGSGCRRGSSRTAWPERGGSLRRRCGLPFSTQCFT